MFDQALTFLITQLNQFLTQRFSTSEPMAVLSNLAHPDGSVPAGIENRLVMALLSVERGDNGAMPSPVRGAASTGAAKPTLKLKFIVAASFDAKYGEGLRALSAAFEFFESHPVFSPQDTSGALPTVNQLVVDMVSADLETLNIVWTSIGAHALPSLIYQAVLR
ncbi:Pvc16 family protein [Paraburkholderia caribensis]|uniref:Pvc16 family protein n=1 Tax=Paraburkholderia caribensis TaxID=75105 RepID=UPI0015915686|nr:Pvc16 family protein [Paraburkholderia caribensis]